MNLQEQANKQLKEITISEIKSILKEKFPSDFSKMLIEENQNISRSNYIYSKLNYKIAERKLIKLNFPLHDKIKDEFSLFEGGISKFNDFEIIQRENMISEFQNLDGVSEIEIDEIDNAFSLPFVIENEDVANDQTPYFLPKYTYKETCSNCNGNKYIKCTDFECEGKHQWQCEQCVGKGELTCETCSGRKKIDCKKCNGNNRIKCNRCGGDGRINDGIIAKAANSKFLQEKKCGDCAGKGYVQCNKCTRGQIVCNGCKGNGKTTCSKCNGLKKITCKKCYGDKEKYGLIDCDLCLTKGINVQLYYVDTTIRNEVKTKLFEKGNLSIDKKTILKHKEFTFNNELIYSNINEKITNKIQNLTIEILEYFKKENGFSENGFPKLLKASINYKVIPCIELSYKHILTNEIHNFTLINIFESPELILHSDAEELKTNVKEVAKSTSKFFSKLFKTKGFKEKEDKKTEIKLLIYLAKSDGKIEEEEKVFLIEQISSFKDFTNSEKKELFDLMNMTVLPKLTKENTNFSNLNVSNQVILKLEKMALADGEFEQSEKDFIEYLKTII